MARPFSVALLLASGLLGAVGLGACERAAAPAPVGASADDPASRVRAAARARAQALDLPGAVIGVRVGDQWELRFAIGEADAESGEPMTLAHDFRVASVSKPFLGTVVLRLAEEGRIDLDAPVAAYLPDVPHAGDVTVRMLANNTAGYFNAVADPAFRAAIEAEPGRLWPADEILAHALDKPLTLETPGEGWSYSNTNSVLLAEIVRRATGEHWSAALERLVAAPLGLTTLRVEEPGATRAVSEGGLPRGYRHATRDSQMAYGNVLIDATEFSSSWAGAAGSMRAALGDALDAAEPVLSGALLAPESRAALHGWIDTGFDSSPGAHSAPATIYYGFQVGKRAIGGRDWIGHTGDVPGFSSFFAYEPSSRTSLVVLSNLSNTPRRLNPAEEIAEAIIATMQERPEPADGSSTGTRPTRR